MSWNIGFSRNFILKLHNKLGLFHIVLEGKSQKISLTIIESQNLPNLQNLDVDSEVSHFESTLNNGRKNIHIGYPSDTKKIERTVECTRRMHCRKGTYRNLMKF